MIIIIYIHLIISNNFCYLIFFHFSRKKIHFAKMNFEDFIDSNFMMKTTNYALITTKLAQVMEPQNTSYSSQIYSSSFLNDFLNINSLVTIFMLLLIFILLSILFCLIMCLKMYITPAIFNSHSHMVIFCCLSKIKSKKFFK